MSNLHCILLPFLVLLLLQNLNTTLCHTKGIRPRRSAGNGLTVNMTRVQYSEQQFIKWVKFVGSLKHSVFKAAKNKLFPSYTLQVAKKTGAGDFTSIQEAIDSLPSMNLVRVIIKVHAGVYTWVLHLLSISFQYIGFCSFLLRALCCHLCFRPVDHCFCPYLPFMFS